MRYLPKNKFDLNICEHLSTTEDAEILKNIHQLLSWTEDINWPVASCILNRLAKIDSDILNEAIKNILRGDDSLWKYSLIIGLLPKLNENQFKKLVPTLEEICHNPLKSDKEEELDILIDDLLSNNNLKF